jgi:hypothetical protein
MITAKQARELTRKAEKEINDARIDDALKEIEKMVAKNAKSRRNYVKTGVSPDIHGELCSRLRKYGYKITNKEHPTSIEISW